VVAHLSLTHFFVAAAEQREAAFEPGSRSTAALVKPGKQFFQENRVYRTCEDYVLERSLALLDSCYKGLTWHFG
jgi:hypothetical protein